MLPSPLTRYWPTIFQSITFNIWCVPELVSSGVARTAPAHTTAQEWLRKQGCRVMNFMPADQDLSTFNLPKGYGKVIYALLTRVFERIVADNDCDAQGVSHAVLAHNSGEPKPLPYRSLRGQVHKRTCFATCFLFWNRVFARICVEHLHANLCCDIVDHCLYGIVHSCLGWVACTKTSCVCNSGACASGCILSNRFVLKASWQRH